MTDNNVSQKCVCQNALTELLRTIKSRSCHALPISLGRVDVKFKSFKTREVRLLDRPISVGIDPVMFAFLEMLRVSNWGSTKMGVLMIPESWFSLTANSRNDTSFPSSDGSTPLILFLPAESDVKFWRRPRSVGSDPWRRFPSKDKTCKETSLPISDDNTPLSLLLASCRRCSEFANDGRVPFRLLPPSDRDAKFVKLPYWDGILPVKAFASMDSSTRASKLASSAGKVPFNMFPETFIKVNDASDDSLPNSLGKVPVKAFESTERRSSCASDANAAGKLPVSPFWPNEIRPSLAIADSSGGIGPINELVSRYIDSRFSRSPRDVGMRPRIPFLDKSRFTSVESKEISGGTVPPRRLAGRRSCS